MPHGHIKDSEQWLAVNHFPFSPAAEGLEGRFSMVMTTKTKIGSNLKGIIFLRAAKCTRVMRLVKRSTLAAPELLCPDALGEWVGKGCSATPPPAQRKDLRSWPSATRNLSGCRDSASALLVPPASGVLSAVRKHLDQGSQRPVTSRASLALGPSQLSQAGSWRSWGVVCVVC